MSQLTMKNIQTAMKDNYLYRLRAKVALLETESQQNNVTGKPSNAFIECQEVHKINLLLVIKFIIHSFEQ